MDRGLTLAILNDRASCHVLTTCERAEWQWCKQRWSVEIISHTLAINRPDKTRRREREEAKLLTIIRDVLDDLTRVQNTLTTIRAFSDKVHLQIARIAQVATTVTAVNHNTAVILGQATRARPPRVWSVSEHMFLQQVVVEQIVAIVLDGIATQLFLRLASW